MTMRITATACALVLSFAACAQSGKVYRIGVLETTPASGRADFPPGTVAHNVTVAWLGPGPFPGNVPAGVTVTTDRSVWDTARARWLARHGCSSFDDCTKLLEPDPQ